MRKLQSNAKTRVAARRDQVLSAATVCFRRHGFHAASMAEIAAEAEMSVGLIYRYFGSKEEIVAAIVRRFVDRGLETFRSIVAEPGDLRSNLIRRVGDLIAGLSEDCNIAIWCEVRSEASRNEAISAMLQEQDEEFEGRIGAVIRKAMGSDLDETEIAARTEMFVLLFLGLSARLVTKPSIDLATVTRQMQLMLRLVLS